MYSSSYRLTVYLIQFFIPFNCRFVCRVLAGCLIGLAYDNIVDAFEYCPIPIAIGPVNCGKSTALTAALSAIGLHRVSIFSRNSAVFTMQLLSSRTCPIGLDDPSHMHDIEQLLVDAFIRGARGTVTHQAQVPHTTPIITMNDIMLQNSIR